MEMLFNPMESISDPAVISSVDVLLVAPFLDFTDEFVEFGIYSIKLFTQRFFHLSDKVRHEFAFEPVDV